MNRSLGYTVPTLLATAILLALGNNAAAQDTTPATSSDAPGKTPDGAPAAGKNQNLETIVVTGTRSAGRTVNSSLTPIDVISADTLLQTGTTDLPQALARLVPSLNFPNFYASDTFAFQRPFQLRGLSPDQVLVLVNGKRWHSGALLLTLGQLGQGSQGADLNTIPMSAVDHIEVLRDGASAQYGSDALAGVINVILKKGADGGDAQFSAGEYSAGDGMQWQASANFGVPLGGDKGWLRLAVDDINQDPTNRSRPDRRAGLAQLGVKFHSGITEFQAQNLFLNTQYNFTPDVQFYAFGHWSQRVGNPYAFFRYGSNYPAYASSSLLAVTKKLGPVFPDGFAPFEHGDAIDRSLVAGLRGTWNDWHWDVSANYGGNQVFYSTLNSINYALLYDTGSSPRDFYDGQLKAQQQTFDVDISREIRPSFLPNPVTLSFGAQWLRQSYDVKAGELGSYYVGTPGIVGGAQGFAGWGPANALSASRHDLSEYVQLETNLTDKLSGSLAGRHEDYSDFGSTTSGALSLRYDFTEAFALRGSLSTGFRAPTLGQQHYNAVTSTAQGVGNSLGLPPGIYLSGLVPVDNPLAKLLGATPLKPETSESITFGAVWNPTEALSASVDIYQITVDDRIAMSSTLSLATPSVIQYLAANGITNLQYSGVRYFTNAGTVRSQGIDGVGSYRADLGDSGTLTTTFSATYNKNKVTNVLPNPEVLNQLSGATFKRLDRNAILGLLADFAPRSKIILSETWENGHWSVTGSATRYGRITSYSSGPRSSTDPSYDDQVFPGKWIFDVAANYTVNRLKFTLGVDNLFNTYPATVIPSQDTNGVFPYSGASPWGSQGAFVYGKVQYRW
ncbi:TonB-dependent receptor [Rudaea sp.]|uniref:TonB-dependent receptor plug domain-containing protein n=1 Tax=Rudaea sp. TaxID=2136325 RepID=UPI00321FDF23